MSDWGAVNERVPALKAGLELEMPSSGGVNDQEIVKAVQDGTLDEAVLDRAVERILRISFQWLDNKKEQPFTMEEDHDFARHTAEQSMVLLKMKTYFRSKQTKKWRLSADLRKNRVFRAAEAPISTASVSAALWMPFPGWKAFPEM